MKIKGSIDINRPKPRVAELFADPKNLKHYQDGFLRKVLVSGQAGQEGAVSNLCYQYGKKEMELTETIRVNRLPDSFEAFYHHKHMDNTMKCTFESIDSNSTRYTYDIEYTRISWVIPRLMALLFPSVYRKQVEKWMRQFKAFAEKTN